MKNVIYFNVVSMIISIVLLIILYSEHRKVTTIRSTLLKISLLMILLSAALGIVYTNIGYYFKHIQIIHVLRYIFANLYFAVFLGIWVCYFYYNYYFVRPYDKLNKRDNIIYICPYFAYLLILILNLYFHNLFAFEENNVFVQKKQFILIYGICFLYIFIILGILIKNKKLLGRHKFIPFMICLSVVFIGIIIQNIQPVLQIENFSMVLGYVILVMNVQNPREILDNETGVLNYGCFKEEIYKNTNYNRDFDIVVIYLGELDNFRTIYQNIQYYRLLKLLGDRIKNVRKELLLYRILQDVFVMIYPQNDTQHMKSDMSKMYEVFDNDFEVDDKNFKIFPVMLHMKYPQDIFSLEDIMENIVILKDKYKYYKGNILTSLDIAFEQQNEKKKMNIILDKMLSERQIDVDFKPIYDVESDMPVSARAIINMKNYCDSKYTYNKFIKICGNNEKTIQLERKLLTNICQMISENNSKLNGIKKVSMSLSNAHYMQETLVEDVLKILKKYRISTKQVEFGISGSALSNLNYTISHNISKFRQAGTAIYMEEYGIGKANLENLINVQVDFIELDRGIYDTANSNERYHTVINRQIEVAHKLGTSILISGLRNASQIWNIKQMNADFYQLRDEE